MLLSSTEESERENETRTNVTTSVGGCVRPRPRAENEPLPTSLSSPLKIASVCEDGGKKPVKAGHFSIEIRGFVVKE